jgi:homoserine O-acetyltransferase
MIEVKTNSVGIVKTRTIRLIEPDQPLELECGKTLAPVDVAYETYGQLNEAGDNVILICHALSGNAHVAGLNNPDDRKPGWWDIMVGPGKGINTNKYFVVCSNFLGGCSGTTGPSSINPSTGKRYGLDFPIITIADMVKVQKILLDRLGIKQLLAVIGGSIGGMQVLQWAIEYPGFVKSAIPIATTSHLGAQIGHITYLSEQGMREKFGRELRNSDSYSYDISSEFAVETYLDYQGQSFVERFDSNSYLYITKAADYFDLGKEYGSLKKAFAKTKCRFLLISFASDWLFTPAQSGAMVNALVANDKDVSYCDITSPYGHDAFLLEPEVLGSFISGFLDATHQPEVKKNHTKNKKKRHTQINDLRQAHRVRVDYDVIESLIKPDSTVLDIGCGNGELLASLIADKNITGKGIELEQDLVLSCVNRGLSIIQQDIELGLEDFADKSYDYVILSQTVQTIKNTETVFNELLRVGKKVIVSFPNFAHWRCRAQLFLTGSAPVTKQLPFEWHNSPNIHCLSLKDFEWFCKKLSVKVEKKIPLIKTRMSPVKFAPNLFAEQVIYVTSKD